jgi:hypothetical protein
MDLDDYLEPEVAVAVAVTAAVASPPVRRVLRRGIVYGLAGLLIARDKVASLAGSVAQGARKMTQSAQAGAGSTQPSASAAPAAGATT